MKKQKFGILSGRFYHDETSEIRKHNPNKFIKKNEKTCNCLVLEIADLLSHDTDRKIIGDLRKYIKKYHKGSIVEFVGADAIFYEKARSIRYHIAELQEAADVQWRNDCNGSKWEKEIAVTQSGRFIKDVLDFLLKETLCTKVITTKSAADYTSRVTMTDSGIER